jgi:hypothetical protein
MGDYFGGPDVSSVMAQVEVTVSSMLVLECGPLGGEAAEEEMMPTY